RVGGGAVVGGREEGRHARGGPAALGRGDGRGRARLAGLSGRVREGDRRVGAGVPRGGGSPQTWTAAAGERSQARKCPEGVREKASQGREATAHPPVHAKKRRRTHAKMAMAPA